MRRYGSRTSRVALLCALLSPVTATSQSGSVSVRSDGPILFAEHIAPILTAHCTGCHQPDGPAPFNLTTIAEVRNHAADIARVIRNRAMPPWLPEPAAPGVPPFVGHERPAASEAARIEQWIQGGMPEGNAIAATESALPARTTGNGGPPDLVVSAGPYVLPAGGGMASRVFVIPLPIRETRYVQRIELRSTPASLVYHADIRLDHTPRSRELDLLDPAPGYDGRLPRTAEYPDGHFVSWSPGQVSSDLSPASAWRIEPGSDLVVLLHMRPGQDRVTVQSSIALTFYDDVPVRAAMVRLGRRNIDIAPGNVAYTTSDSFVLPVDTQLQVLQPHAHDYARTLVAEARLPDGTARRLLQIKKWEPRWQRAYRYESPVPLPRGTTVSMTYSFSNPPRSGVDPRRIRFGPGVADAVGDVWLQLTADTPEAQVALERAVHAKMLAEDIVGYETLLNASPFDASLYDDLAFLCLDAGRADAAASYLTSSLELNPGSAVAHTRLGTVMLQREQVAEAQHHFEEALRIDAGHAEAHYQMGSVNWLQGENAAAAERFERALSLTPNHPRALMDLSWIRSSAAEETLRNPGEALRLATRAVELTKGGDAAAFDALAAAQAAMGQFDRAVETAERALRFDIPELLAEAIRSRREIYSQGLAFVVLDPR